MVAWAPVPKARPGSITTGIASPSGCSHGGPTQSGPTRTGRWKAASGPPSPPRPRSTARRRKPTRAVPPHGRPCRPPARRRRRVALLEALREELEHDRAGPLGFGGRDRHRTRRSVSGTRSSACRRSPRRWPVRLLVGRRSKCRAGARCSSVSRRGTVTLTSSGGHPARGPGGRACRRRGSRAPRPGCVPGSNSSSTSPSMVGTVTVVPSAACVMVRSTCRDQVVALADEPRIGLDANEHVQVAGAPADLAGVSLAAEPDALAVMDPRRDLDRDRALLDRAPAPPHVVHGCSTMRPEPPQRGHACARTNWPKTVFDTCCTRPGAAAGGARDRVRARARRRCRRRSRRRRRRGTGRPGSRPGPNRPARSRPRRRRRRRGRAARPPPTPKRSSPKNAENRSPSAAEVEARRREAAGCAGPRGRSGRRARGARGSRAPRTPRRPP